MRTAAFAVIIFVLATGVASAATPELWAIDAGSLWGEGVSYTIGLDPFITNAVGYPSSELDAVVDAAYVPSTSTLYLSGWGPNNTSWYEPNTIAVYSGGPAGVSFVSLSNEGMGNRHWLAGIEYLDGSLYAIGYEDFEGDVFLIRIDNPGTPSQTVTQVGDYFGDANNFGVPQSLCSDSRGNLIGAFITYGALLDNHLYSIDPLTGVTSLLHSYSTGFPDSEIFRGMDRVGDKLYALTNASVLYEIDENTYDLTELGSLQRSVWMALVAVPEPGMVVMMLGGVAVLMLRRWR